MKKITMIAIALIAICFVSGGYALYNNGMADIADTSASDSVTGDSINSNSESSPNNENSLATDVSKSLEIISNSLEPVLKLLDYSSDYSAVTPTHRIQVLQDYDLTGYTVSNSEYYSFYAPEGYDTTDKFAQCAECGKYFSYGLVTKSLPDYAICRGHDDSSGGVFDPNNPWILSYDETMYVLEHDKVPENVFNRVYNHYGTFGSFASYDDYLADIAQEHNEPIHTEPVTGYVPISIEDGEDAGIVSYNFEDSNVDESPADTVVYC